MTGDFIGDISDSIRGRVDPTLVPTDSSHLFELYALLALSVGTAVSERDIHNAWCIWMRPQDPGHPSLVPFEQLDSATQQQDRPFAVAVRDVARQIPISPSSRIESALFHAIDEHDEKQVEQRFEQYKIMVESSERLVARRQGVNTFFLTANGAIITALGLIAQAATAPYLKAIAIAILSFAAVVLCFAWGSLISSFGQLNTGKFAVINRIESRLPLGTFSAEWEALGRGENPKVYRSFTHREAWVPRVLVGIYIIITTVAICIALIAPIGGLGILLDQPPTTVPASPSVAPTVGLPTR